MNARRLAISRHLDSVRDLADHGNDGRFGRLDLGLEFGGGLGRDWLVGGRIDGQLGLSQQWGKLSAFGQAFGRMSRSASGWVPEVGGVAGLRLEF